MPNWTALKWRRNDSTRNSRVCCLLLFLLIYSLPSVADEGLQNHPSPYIRLHANDAVQWRLWNASVLQQAREQNKLILVSIGYYACHWCHVMRNESFNESDVAAVLNRQFIPVKVDRELEPALDDYLMDFVQKTRGYAGWPLNVFVTPQGYPLLGMVYLPRQDFIQLLHSVANEWRQEPAKLNQMAQEAFRFGQLLHAGSHPLPDDKELYLRFIHALMNMADELQGGLGHQAKFPQPALLQALLTFHQQQPDQSWLAEYLHLTLRNIATRGLHDIIGGGFFRYTTDPDWHTPHFEKMLYTNAGLMQVYVRAYEVFDDVFYLDMALETAGFLLREMMHESGGFISSLSAQDSSNVEGGSYLWEKQDFRHILTDAQWEQVNAAWSFYHMTDSQLFLPTGVAVDKRWDAIKQRLLKKRKNNPSPEDEKKLPSWNGYTLSALAKLYAVKPLDDLRRAGDRLYAWLMNQVNAGLFRNTGTEQRRYLEDYAFVAQGVLDWGMVREKPDSTIAVNKLVNQAMDLFLTPDGWRLSDEQIIPLPGLKRVLADGDLPSSAAVMAALVKRTDGNRPINFSQVDRLFLADLAGHASTVEYLLLH
ncbi:MAG: thioredoxin domain-containing protein [Gammaproteobacteria bacterium]|nr:MAG: thioredoxin domain-containing protein [Gammaproteobacteria bacterium]